MSKKQAIAFFEEISKNQQLAQEVEKVVKGKNSDEAKVKELLSLAKKYNFNFTQEDAKNAQGALKTKLSPEEMLEVSGGKLNLKSSLMAAAMLLGLGASGAALHNMEASAMKRSAPSSSGKRGKTDQTLPGFDELISSLSNRAPQGQPTTNGNQPQPTTTGTANSRQNETPPSNGQGSAQSDSQQTTRRTTSDRERHAPKPPREEKKARATVEHDKTAAERFSSVKNCGSRLLQFVRSVASSGALPAADWPAAPAANWPAAPAAWFWREAAICRFCGGTLSARGGEEARDVKCANAGCIYNWVFTPTSNRRFEGNQRGQKDCGHYARWALLPALILDSRYKRISTGTNFKGAARTLPIETPAEAWAVWQLIVGHRFSWVNVIEALIEHDVDETTIGIVILLLEESYDNLVQGNEHLRAIGLGSEVQQLVEDHNNGWQQVRTTMEQHGYDAEEAIKRLEQSYNMLTDEQRQLSTQQWQQAEEARRQTDETVRQVIEKPQRGEELSLEEARVIAPMLKCGKCGKTGASARQIGGRVYFYCPKCQKAISKKPAALLDMLQAAAPGNIPMGMADAEQNEQPMQFEIQPRQMNQGEGPTYEVNSPWGTAPQIGTQGMSQFSLGQPTIMQQNVLDMEDDDYLDMNDYAVDVDDSPNALHEDYENQMTGQPHNTQVDQNQHPTNDQPEQLAAQPQQNQNANGITWLFNFKDFEDDSLIPGSSGAWLGPRWKK